MAEQTPERGPLEAVNFVCTVCDHTFQDAPARVEDAPDREWHPWRYFGTCPVCRGEGKQAAWEQGLMAAYGRQTGPKTPEGKAKAAANLDGHPTPEEAQRTRFNAMKHGLFARVATYFPAKPGAYPRCQGCEHLASEECRRYHACLKQAELFIRYRAAFDARDPELIRELNADTQAAVQALINDMILAIAQDGGPRISFPDWYYDKDGRFRIAAYTDDKTGERVVINKLEAHPLLKHLIDFLNKNALTMADMEMTPKVQSDQETMQGFLNQEEGEQQSAREYQQRMEHQTNKLLELIEGGQRYMREKVVDGEVVRDE